MQLLKYFHELSLHPNNAKELKRLILQLAVQGKLTRDFRVAHPELRDGSYSASALLDQIKAEKEQLIKVKKIKKENPLPAILPEEIPFELPDGWVWCRLGEIVSLKSGTTFSKDIEGDFGDFMYVKVGGMNLLGNEVEITTANSYICKTPKVENALIPSRSIIFPKRGGAIATNKKRIVNFPILVDLNTMAIICPNQLNFSYLFHWFLTIDLWKLNNGTSVPQINNKDIAPLIIPIPSLSEQKAIVETVNQLFKEVEQLEQLTVERIQLKEQFATSALNQLATNNTVKEWAFLQEHFHPFFNHQPNIKKLRETILQLAVQGKLTSDFRASHPELNTGSNSASALLDQIKAEKARLIKEKKIKKENPLPAIKPEEIPYELPEGWVWCRISEIVDVGTGSTPVKSEIAYYLNGTIPWYTSSATNSLFAATVETKITQKALKETNCKIFPSGSLIIAMYGQGKTRGQISELVEAGATNQAIAAMVFFESSLETKPFVKYYFRKIYSEIRLLAEGGAQPNLSVGKVKSTLIPLPPPAEQKAIVETVNRLMALCDQLEQEVQLSEQQVELVMKGVLR